MSEGSYLDPLFWRVNAALELVSTQKAMTLSPKINGGSSDAPAIPLLDAPHLDYRRRYEACQSDERRREVIRDQLNDLAHFRRSGKRVDLGTVEGRREIGLDMDPAGLVARKYGVSRATVYRCRELVGSGIAPN